jgi:hypothetical protein
MTTKIWDKESIQELLRASDAAVARAILALYARQTEAEKAAEHTKVENGVGFNANDAPFLTSIAKALPKWNNHMTPRQLAKARPMVMKYHRQLAEIANNTAKAGWSSDPVIAAVQVQKARNPNFARF